LDKNYWNQYYTKHNKLGKPTSFSKSIINKIPPHSNIMELGCGNGRDSYYFASKGHTVIGCDQSEMIINSLPNLGNNSPTFLVEDIKKLSKKFNHFFDVIYARFVLHALNDKEAIAAVKWAYENLHKNGLFFSESRSIKDPIFGDGEKVKNRIYKTDHKRRFIKKNEIIQVLMAAGFVIDDVIEKQGLAIYKDSNPVVIRITARKP